MAALSAGFGNPLLSGSSGSDRRAWSRQACADAQSAGVQQVPALPVVQVFFRGGRIDVAVIRRQQPFPRLPTKCARWRRRSGLRRMPYSPDAEFLGPRATEGTLKSLNATGTLKSWRVTPPGGSP
jgi:hypothetical protein